MVSVDWRKDVKTYFELSQEKPVMLIEHLIPEKALTIMRRLAPVQAPARHARSRGLP